MPAYFEYCNSIAQVVRFGKYFWEIYKGSTCSVPAPSWKGCIGFGVVNMLEFVTETESVWVKLARERRPLALYGMGDGAVKILARLAAMGRQAEAIFASDEFVRGQAFAGFHVERYADVLRRLGPDVVVVIAFATERPEVLARFAELARAHTVYAPHVPIFTDEEVVDADFLRRYERELQCVYDRLADDASRAVFAAALNYKLSGDIRYLLAVTTERRRDLETLFTWGADEGYADLGAYNGDTVREFLQLTGGRCRHIVAVEPDGKSYTKLCAYVAGCPQLPPDRVTCVHAGAWSEPGQLGFTETVGRQAMLLTPQTAMAAQTGQRTRTGAAAPEGLEARTSVATQAEATVDALPGLKPVKAKAVVAVDSLDHLMAKARTATGERMSLQATYIKVDVEGVEQQALAGMAWQLRGRPKLLLAAYHHDVDLFRLPLALWRAQPDYQIYLRKHPYIPCWELNFFCR